MTEDSCRSAFYFMRITEQDKISENKSENIKIDKK